MNRSNSCLIVLFFLTLYTSNCAFSQHYTRTDTIPVKQNGVWLKNPWVGGHNYCQFSEIDMNFDGIKDLFVLDRSGHRITTYINKGTPNTVDYIDSTVKYAPKFPHIEDWALLRDYNCDGKADIFAYNHNGGIKVWKNTSTAGNLQFTLEKSFLKTSYCPAPLSLSITGVDLPTIDDIDNDGDLDILTYDTPGLNMEFHVNKSKEKGYGCDSLIFDMDCSGCWGNYRTSISGCNVVVGTCRKPGKSELPNPTSEYHAGNCSLCLDLDGDGDKEILLGQLGCCNYVQLTNGGNAASANMVAMDDSFPSYDMPATLTSFPCGFFLDLNNDGKRDLVVSPNAPNVSVSNQSIWYYLNKGTDKAPVFSREMRDFLQKDMIEVGEGADPVFFDFDSDGLKDLLVSNYKMVIDSCPTSELFGTLAFKNIGTAASPKFELVNSDYANLSAVLPLITNKHMAFGDVDGDTDKDLFIGDYDGFIHYFSNTAAPSSPADFTYNGTVYNVTTSTPIDVGSHATPQLIDLDRDGDLDLVVGEMAGNLNYYKNTGTVNSYSFTLASSSFGGVDVLKPCCTGYSVPYIYEEAGSYNMLIGSNSDRTLSNGTGWLWHYNNIEGNLAGNFSLVDSMFHNIWEGARMIVSGDDINNDGSMDLVIGNYSGGVAIYLGDTSTVPVAEITKPHFDFSIYPNPSKGQLNILVSNLKKNEKVELIIYNTLGQSVFTASDNIPSNNQLRLSFDVSSLGNGIYSCEINTKSYGPNPARVSRLSKKLILLNY